MKPKKTVIYHDALNDDFAGTNIKQKPFPKKFKYIHPHNPVWFLFSALLYYVIAVPLFFLVSKIGYGVKVKGRKNLRRLRLRGCFFYGNHTQISDAWNVQAHIAWGKRSFIVANPDAISIPFVRWIVMMLGCLPVPDEPHHKDFVEAVGYHIKKRHGVIIYPEAHIWPYSTHIRPYDDQSFVYPATLGAPVVALCTTYRAPLLFPNRRPPRMTIHVSQPIYPDMEKSLPERKKELRDRVYEFMLDYSCEDENVEYIRYVKAKEEDR